MTRHAGGRDRRLAMFDDVIVGLNDDDAALDAFALAKTLVSTGGELTVVRVERGDETPRGSAPQEALAAFNGAPLVVVTAPSAAAGLRDVVLHRRADLLVVGA
jgi:hypothetical protein